MKSLKSDLSDRKLRFDGVSEVDPSQLARFLLLGVPPSKLRVSAADHDVEEFNTQVGVMDEIKVVGNEPINLDMGWKLPEKYQKLDLHEHFGDLFEKVIEGKSEDYIDKAIGRIAHELEEVENRGMVEFMRTVIFIIDELKANNVVWGVGRGSSCASYLLFLIGLHVVDCVTMDVDPDEFYHD